MKMLSARSSSRVGCSQRKASCAGSASASKRASHVCPFTSGSKAEQAPPARNVLAMAASAEAPVDLEQARAEEVRVLMAKAMNATVVRFNVPEYKTSPGNWLAIVGNVDELGAWTASQGARMKWLPGHTWICDVILPEHYSGTFEFKLVLMNEKGLCVWEPGANRKLKVPDTFDDSEEKLVDVSLHWGLREPEPMDEEETIFPDLEEMQARAEEAVATMPGINAASVLLQTQQQLSDSKRRHREQVTDLREELTVLQESHKRETNRVQARMRDLERVMEKIQARLDKEREISEAHIELLKSRIADKKVGRSRTGDTPAASRRPRAAASKAAAAAAAAPAAAAAVNPDIAVYESHVMSILPNYSGLSLERLHNMLGQSVLMPKYKKDNPTELGHLLDSLVANNKITMDNGIYRYRSRDGSIVGSRRTRTPRASTITVDARLLELEPSVMSCLGSTTGMSLERLFSMLSTMVPAGSCTAEQLAALLNHLEVEGKVYKDRGLYRYAKANARAPSPRPVRGLPEAMPPRATAAPRRTPRARAPAVEDDREAAPPPGSVAGGPPGSVAGGPPAGYKLSGGSIMPAFDSTGAHPTLDMVSEFEQPVLELLSVHKTLPINRMYNLMAAKYPKFAQHNVTELKAVLKNLTDQHKIVDKSETYTFIRF